MNKISNKLINKIFSIMAVAACFMVVIMLLVAGWSISHHPRLHESNYAAYYSAEEYRRLTKDLDNPPINNSSSVAARPVDAER